MDVLADVERGGDRGGAVGRHREGFVRDERGEARVDVVDGAVERRGWGRGRTPRDGARADGGFGAFPTGEEVVGEGEEASLDGGGELNLAEVAEGAEGAARGVDVGANASRDAVDVGGDAAVDDASDAREETRAEVAHDGDEHPVDVLFAAELGGGAQLERAQRLGDRVRGLALATRVALAGAHEIPRLELQREPAEGVARSHAARARRGRHRPPARTRRGEERERPRARAAKTWAVGAEAPGV